MRGAIVTNGLKREELSFEHLLYSRCFAYTELFNPCYNNPPSNTIFDVETLLSPILKMKKLKFRDFWRLLILENERLGIWTKFGLIPECSYLTMCHVFLTQKDHIAVCHWKLCTAIYIAYFLFLLKTLTHPRWNTRLHTDSRLAFLPQGFLDQRETKK